MVAAKEYRTKLSSNGRIMLPAGCRKAMNLSPEEELIIRVVGEEATIFSVRHAVDHAQGLVAQHNKSRKSLVSQLLTDRKEESDRE